MCECHDDQPRRGTPEGSKKTRPTIDFKFTPLPKVKKYNNLCDEVAPLIPRLNANPGDWAQLVHYNSKSGAQAGRKQLKECFPNIEFTVRNYTIFGRKPKDNT